MQKLTYLAITENKLTELPLEVCSLLNLESLLVGRNPIRHLPDEIKHLTRLKELEVANCMFDEFPKQVRQLRALEKLHAGGNRLTVIPDEVSDLQHLQFLTVDINLLQALPSTVSNLKKLREVYIPTNKFEKFPEALCDLPALEKVDIRNNQITRLPITLHRAGKLKELDVSGNPLTYPPQDICQQGTSAIMTFLKQEAEKDEKLRKSFVTLTGVVDTKQEQIRIARYLGISDEDVKSIQAESPDDVLYQVLQKWREKWRGEEGPETTLSRLTGLLSELGLREAARSISHKKPRLDNWGDLTDSTEHGKLSINLPIIDELQLDGGEFIGRGAFAEVRKARHRDWDVDVAVKRLTQQVDGVKEKDLLYSEVKKMIIASTSPHIVDIRGICLGLDFSIVMTYMENGSLKSLLKEEDIRVNWALRWRIAHEISLGLNFLHCLDPQIIHCDVKAANVLLDNDFHAKIGDFGLAKWRTKSRLVQSKSPEGVTPTHAAPEHFQGREPDAKFDVYSFGITLWEILTRKKPYEYIKDEYLATIVRGGDRPTKAFLPTDTEGMSGMVTLMNDCWHGDPLSRPNMKAKGCATYTDYDMLEAVIAVKRGKDEKSNPQIMSHPADLSVCSKEERHSVVLKEDSTPISTSGSQSVKAQTVSSPEDLTLLGSYTDSKPVETEPSNGLDSQTATVEIVVTPDDSYSTVSSGTYAEAQPVQSCNVPSSLTVRTETVVGPEDCYSTTSGPYNNPEPVVIQPGNDSTSQTVRPKSEAGPDPSYSTISGIYKDPEAVVIQPGNDSTSRTVRTESETGREQSYSTISGIYKDPEPVVIQPDNDSTSRTVRTEVEASPGDCYSTISGPYNNPEPVVIQPDNSTDLTVRTESKTGPDPSYSKISGIYKDPEPVVIQNDSTSQTVRTEVEASPEDDYSTISSGIYTDPHDVQLGGTASAVRGRLRSPGVESSDRETSPSDGVEEKTIRCGRFRHIFSRPKLTCALIMTSVVAVTLTVTLVGVFLGGPMEDNHLDDLYPATSTLDTEPTIVHVTPSNGPWQYRFSATNMVIRIGPGSANPNMVPESTYAINATFTVEPTTTALSNSSNADVWVDQRLDQTLSLSAIAVSSANEIFVADRYNHRIYIHNMEGAYLGHFTTLVPGYAVYVRSMIPQDMSIDGKDNLWVVGHISQLCSAVVQYSKEGQGLSIFQKCGERYGGIAVDLRNNHIVLKQVNKLEVHIYRPDGSLVRKIGGKQFAYSNAVVVNNIHGSILMLKENTVRVVLYNQYGQDFYSFGSRGSGEGELMVPTDICTDSSGQVIVAERRNRRVSVFTSRGEFVRHVNTGQKMVKLVAVGPKGQLVVTYHFDDTMVFSTKDRHVSVWMVFSTKDRHVSVWMVFSTKDRHVSVWMVFSTKDRHVSVWMVFSTKDRHVSVWMVFSTKDRHVSVWMVFSTKDRHVSVWMVFSTKDRHVWLRVDGVQHQGQECSCQNVGEVFAVDLSSSGDVLKRKCGFPDPTNFGEDNKNGEAVAVGKSSVVRRRLRLLQRRLDQTRPGDLKTPDEYQVCPDVPVLTEKSVMRGDVCANQLTEDMMKSLNRCVLRVGCPDWEKPVKTAQQTS
ncbi:hypothetical protein Bbelb_351490 [Branchiostoma belcheri]|nr:hypothetical protein Bbelb_351490 [Branchiostoma belcheri]